MPSNNPPVDGAIVWMSAGNSYFKEEVIMKLLEFASEKFLKVIVMAPDEPAEHTFKALGLYSEHFKRKARLNANLLQNRARRVIGNLINKGIKTDFKVVEWTDEIIPNPEYQGMLKSMRNLYYNNEVFRNDARETTKEVILNKLSKNADLEKAIDEAVIYLLEELAFVLASPRIYNAPKMTYLYHHDWLIYKNLITGRYDKQHRPELAFMLTQIE